MPQMLTIVLHLKETHMLGDNIGRDDYMYYPSGQLRPYPLGLTPIGNRCSILMFAGLSSNEVRALGSGLTLTDLDRYQVSNILKSHFPQ